MHHLRAPQKGVGMTATTVSSWASSNRAVVRVPPKNSGLHRVCADSAVVVLSHRFDFCSWDVIEHSHTPVDWDLPTEQQQHPLAAKEPRKGQRLSLAADVVTPQGQLRVYCCHLEVRPVVFLVV